MRTVFPYQAEDPLKAEFFDLSRGGFFVGVGANDPRHGSQSWSFEQAGWNGILIEPQPDLDDILVETGAPTSIDFVSIDVEGHEVEILRGFDLARWRPRLLLVEDHVTDLPTHRFLTRAGYRLIQRTGLNGRYVPRAVAPASAGDGGSWFANIISAFRSAWRAIARGACATERGGFSASALGARLL